MFIVKSKQIPIFYLGAGLQFSQGTGKVQFEGEFLRNFMKKLHQTEVPMGATRWHSNFGSTCLTFFITLNYMAHYIWRTIQKVTGSQNFLTTCSTHGSYYTYYMVVHIPMVLHGTTLTCFQSPFKVILAKIEFCGFSLKSSMQSSKYI